MSSIYMQLQSSAANGSVFPGQPIVFDIVKSQSTGVDYITTTGMIIISTPGTYLIEWSVAADSPAPFQIGLVTSTPQGIITGATTEAPSTLSNAAVVIVPDNVPVTITLVNQSLGQLTYSNLPIVANLVVYANIAEAGGGSSAKTLTIPFSSAFGPTCYPSLDANGQLTSASIIGCGQSNDIPISYQVTGGTIIQVPFATNQAQYLFSFPYNVRLVAASGIFNNYTPILLKLPTTIISPFISIATQAIPNTYTFDIREESQVYPTPGYQMLSIPPVNIPSSTILTAVKTDLNVPIAAGTPFAIVGGLKNLGLSPQAVTAYIYMHGTMVFEIDE